MIFFVFYFLIDLFVVGCICMEIELGKLTLKIKCFHQKLQFAKTMLKNCLVPIAEKKLKRLFSITKTIKFLKLINVSSISMFYQTIII